MNNTQIIIMCVSGLVNGLFLIVAFFIKEKLATISTSLKDLKSSSEALVLHTGLLESEINHMKSEVIKIEEELDKYKTKLEAYMDRMNKCRHCTP